MKITDIKFDKANVKEGSKLLGVCDVVFDNCFVIHGVKVLSGSKGNYIQFPHKVRKKNDGDIKVHDICHPINTEFRHVIEDIVLEGYEEWVEDNGVEEVSNAAGEAADNKECISGDEVQEES